MKLKVAILLPQSALLLLAFISFKTVTNTYTADKDTTGYAIDTLATNLVVPWQILFLPDGGMMFTERAGRVRLFKKGKLLEKPVFTVEDVAADRKMGLLGMALHPAFKINHFVYLASNYVQDGQMMLKVLRYTFADNTFSNSKTIIDNIPANQNHTGCRLVFGPDKKLYVTAGDADKPMQAQDLKQLNGKILRLNDDGSIPADNPFVKNDTARKEIWSYGHRNPQGLAFQPGTGFLFDTEHGPTGGDEVNIIRKGENYGWPVIHHRDTKPGMNTPLLEYSPSIGPGEALFYQGNTFPELKGSLLIACLRGEGILQLKMSGNKVLSQQMLFKKRFGRIRSLVTGPDGSIYFSTSMVDMPESKGNPPYDMILRLRSVTPKHTFQGLAMNNEVVAAQGVISTEAMFQQLCASCHGDKLQGTERVKSLLDGKFVHGSTKAAIINTINNGVTEKGMPAWKGAIKPADVEKLADFIIRTTRP